MRIESWDGLRARITGGTDREGGGDGPVVVLLHGFGAPGDDLVSLWRVLDVPREVRFVFPEAPLSVPEVGSQAARAWWRLDLDALSPAGASARARDRSNEVPEGLLEANQRVSLLLDRVERELGVSGDKIVLGGFSQGAMVSCDVALSGARPLAGLLVFSGTLLARARWQTGSNKRAGLPVVQSHGRADPLLPFAGAEALRDLLEAAGCKLRFVEFRGAHEIPPVALAAASELIRTST